MSLFLDLKNAKTEEDVKDIYIKALGLKVLSKNLVDIETKDVWFEAKKNPSSVFAMFTQLLYYVNQARIKGEYIPPFLCVFDCLKASILQTKDVLPLLDRQSIQWGKNATQYTEQALIEISNYIGVYITTFAIESHESEFIQTLKNAIASGSIQKIGINPNNLKQVFDKWVDLVGKELQGVDAKDYALFFFADAMWDGQNTVEDLPVEIMYKGGNPVFFYNNKKYELYNQNGHRQLWAIYDRPPKKEHRAYLLERRDTLIPDVERVKKGAFYTPLAVVSKSYGYLDTVLGADWQKEYLVWDMCCGVGNLETKHNFPRNVYMSTLDQADIDIMKTNKVCVGAERFQYDYLNDDIDSNGNFDYSLTNKMPMSLRKAIEDSKKNPLTAKKILILINPPYLTPSESSTKGTTATNCSNILMKKDYGLASNELFVQFLVRVSKEIPNAVLGLFSPLKYLLGETCEKFRQLWNYEFRSGFVFSSGVFDGVKGEFPLGFLVWQGTDELLGKMYLCGSSFDLDVLDRSLNVESIKNIQVESSKSYLNKWVSRPKANKDFAIPLKNSFSPAYSFYRSSRWSENAVGYFYCDGNDMTCSLTGTCLLSSIYSNPNGMYVNASNLLQVAMVYSVRRTKKYSWLVKSDPFYQPYTMPNDDFALDCLMFMLFDGMNLSASSQGLSWDGVDYPLVNHFVPFTEKQVGANDRFESAFMSDFLAGKTFTQESQAVYDEGLKLWKLYFEYKDEHSLRNELHLHRSDVGWYQIRKALEKRKESGLSMQAIDFKAFSSVFEILKEKIRNQAIVLGFVR